MSLLQLRKCLKLKDGQTAILGRVVISLGELIKGAEEAPTVKQRKLSQVTDMIHAAHDLHRLQQNSIMSLLVGDYLLARSSVDMADLRYPRTVELIAKGLEDYTSGEFLKLQLVENSQKKLLSAFDVEQGVERYAELTSGSLLSNACLSMALLSGYPDKSNTNTNSISNLVYNFGFHTGTAHRLIEFLYCPSDDDKAFIESIDVKQFEDTIQDHLDKSEECLLSLPDGEKRSSLLHMLNDMKKLNPRILGKDYI